MFNDKYLTKIIDINKYSFYGYADIFLRDESFLRNTNINLCDNEIEILLKTNEFYFYIKWLETMINIENDNKIHHKIDKKGELIINSYYFEINNINHLYYFNFNEIDECTEFIMLLNTKGNFIAVGHNGGHLFIDTDKFSFCQSDGTGDVLFDKNVKISKQVLLKESLNLIDYIISNYTITH